MRLEEVEVKIGVADRALAGLATLDGSAICTSLRTSKTDSVGSGEGYNWLRVLGDIPDQVSAKP